MKYLLAALLGLSAIAIHGDETSIQGRWAVVVYDQNGQRPDDTILKKLQVVIGPNEITIRPKLVAEYKPVFKNGKLEKEVVFSVDENKVDQMKYRLTSDKGWIDLGDKNITKGIFTRNEDSLTICFSGNEKKNRPKKIVDQPKTGIVRLVLSRVAEK